jgi:hypothetical protein
LAAIRPASSLVSIFAAKLLFCIVCHR